MNKVLFLSFFAMIVLNIAHPVTPLLINSVNLPSFTFGILYSAMAIAQFVMSPIWGSLSDSKGRKNILIIGILGYGIGQLGFGFSSNFYMILFFRVVGGFFSVDYLTSIVAYISDITSKEERVKYMSYQVAFTSRGASVGYLIGGFFGNYGYKVSFLVQFLLSIGVAIYIYFSISETINEKKEFNLNLNHLKIKKNVNLDYQIKIMMIAILLVSFASTSYSSTIAYYVESVLSLSTGANGIIMSVAGVLALISNLVINPYLSKKYEEKNIMRYVLIFSGISIIISSLIPNIVVSFIFLGIFILNISLVTPLQQSIVTKLSKDNYGEIIGMQGSFKALGMVSASLVAGFVFDFGNKLPFMFAGISCIGAYLVMKNIIKKA